MLCGGCASGLNVCLSMETKKNNVKIGPQEWDSRIMRESWQVYLSVRLTFFKFSHFLFQKCSRAGYELFLSRIDLIRFLSLFYNYFVTKVS